MVELDEIRDRLTSGNTDVVQSIRVGGSLSRGHGDQFSDIDIFVNVAASHCDMKTAGLLASRLGPAEIIDVPRSDHTWGIWVTGYYVQFGYIDLFVRANKRLGVTYMTDPSSIVIFDVDGKTSDAVSLSGTDLPAPELVRANLATSWLKLYKAAKEFYRGGHLQGDRYVWSSVEGSVAAIRLSRGILPPGRNLEQSLRSLEIHDPDLEQEVRAVLHPSEADPRAASSSMLWGAFAMLKQALSSVTHAGFEVRGYMSDVQLRQLGALLTSMTTDTPASKGFGDR